MSDSRPGDIFSPGDLLNNTYRIEAVLGRGGTSEVYRARNENSGRVVAIKALRSEFSQNDDYMHLMRREEEIREVRHDVVLRYYDIQRTEDGRVYLIMDFVDGPGLNQNMLAGGMSAAELLIIAERVAEGLEAAHAKNIVHRDLSPDNIILNNGDPSQAVIIDFGIAKDENPGAETIVGTEFAGKYAYAAPEQLAGTSDARSDIYSLGALLLATYRGAAPDVGGNPLEVVNNKSKPLDTEGVPEPLKTLVDRMTTPDSSERLQSASAVLAALRNEDAGGTETSAPEPEDDRTVVVPKPSATPQKTEKRQTKPKDPSGSKRSPMGAVIAVLAVVAIGAGGYAFGLFDAFLGPSYENADPFTFHAEQKPDGRLTAAGNIPSERVQDAVQDFVVSHGGSAELVLASGNISDGWGDAVVGVLSQVADLPEWRVLVSNDQIAVTGLSEDLDQKAQVTGALNSMLPDTMTGSVDIMAGPRILPAALLDPIVSEFADCGALALRDPPPLGYPLDATVFVDGRVAEIATRVELADAISEIAGSRQVQVTAEVLNPTLCKIDAALPNAPAAGFEILFGYGDRPDQNPSGRYFVGENPVIDLEIPASVIDGFLYVSALDVSGNVFHLLPNRNRPDNSVEALRDGASGAVRVRLAYPLADADGGKNLAFVIDPETLGKTKIVAILGREKIFGDIRPTTESAEGFVAALMETSVPVVGMDSRILVSENP